MTARDVALVDADGTVLWEGPLDEFAASRDFDPARLLDDLRELQETEGRRPEALDVSTFGSYLELSLVEVAA